MLIRTVPCTQGSCRDHDQKCIKFFNFRSKREKTDLSAFKAHHDISCEQHILGNIR